MEKENRPAHQGLAFIERKERKREKMSSLQKDGVMMMMKAKEERSKRRRK